MVSPIKGKVLVKNKITKSLCQPLFSHSQSQCHQHLTLFEPTSFLGDQVGVGETGQRQRLELVNLHLSDTSHLKLDGLFEKAHAETN